MRLLLVAALLLPGLASAEIYKWTDAQGRVHFDQRQMAGSTQVEVKPQIIERDDATRQREQRADSVYKARRDEATVADQRAQKHKAQMADYCVALRKKLAEIPPGESYYSVNTKGERSYYTDQQLDAARRELNQQIAQDCD